MADESGKGGGEEAPVGACGYMCRSLHAIFLQKPLLALMHGFFPLALYYQYTRDPNNIDDTREALLFGTSLLAIVPQAERLGYVTEQLALHVGETTSGLLNATCGNIPELVVAIIALLHGTPKVVQDSLLGGVLSNLLLVTGLSCLAGGIKHHVQTFSTMFSANLLAALVVFSIVLFLDSTLSENLYVDNPGDNTAVSSFPLNPSLVVSRVTAVLALISYLCFLVFSLGTHKAELEDHGGGDDDDDEEEEEEDVLGITGSLFWLAVLTGLLSWVSDGLVDAIEGAARATGLSELFVVSIVLPNVNNALEHAVAIRLAMANKMDAVMAIAVGSAAQLALLLLPICAIVEWGRGRNFDFHFAPIEAGAFTMSIIFAAIALQSGRSTWMLGISFLLVYIGIAAAWFFAPETHHRSFYNETNIDPSDALQQMIQNAELDELCAVSNLMHINANPALAAACANHVNSSLASLTGAPTVKADWNKVVQLASHMPANWNTLMPRHL